MELKKNNKKITDPTPGALGGVGRMGLSQEQRQCLHTLKGQPLTCMTRDVKRVFDLSHSLTALNVYEAESVPFLI